MREQGNMSMDRYFREASVLGKLLKYDLKALGRVLLPVQLGALVVGVNRDICAHGHHKVHWR